MFYGFIIDKLLAESNSKVTVLLNETVGLFGPLQHGGVYIRQNEVITREACRECMSARKRHTKT